MEHTQYSLSQCPSHEVALWIHEFAHNDSEHIQQRGLLSSEELDRADKFKHQRSYQRYIESHAFVRSVLSKYLKIPPESIELVKNTYGKPALVKSDWQFNLSHNDFYAVCAISRNDIGVDIESTAREIEILPVAKRFFHPNEYRAIAGTSEQECRKVFFQYWTLKEAFVKAIGLGLRYPLDSFALQCVNESWSLGALVDEHYANDWHCQSITFQKQVIGVVNKGSCKTVVFTELHAEP